MLKALAEGGTAGKLAQEAAEAQLVAGRQSAVSEAMRRAAVINAPSAATEQNTAVVAAPYDRRRPVLAAAGASRDAALRSIEAANTSYMDQLNAAVPVLERNVQLARLRKAQEAERYGIPDVLKQLGGVTAARALVNDGLEGEAQRQAADFSERRGASGPGSAPRSIDEIRDERLGQRTEDVGLPRGFAPALRLSAPRTVQLRDVGSAAKAAGIDSKLAATITGRPSWATISDYYRRAAEADDAPASAAEIEAQFLLDYPELAKYQQARKLAAAMVGY